MAPEDLKFHPHAWWEFTRANARLLLWAALASLALHVLVALGLALWRYQVAVAELVDPLIVTWLSPEAERAAQAEAKRRFENAVDLATLNLPSRTPGTQPAQAPAAVAAANRPSPAESLREISAEELRSVLGGRGSARRDELLQRFGGTRETENAVSLGLAWLVKVQQPDGRWQLHTGYDDAGRSSLRTDTGATALALLAFLGAGHTPQAGKYREPVARGCRWLTQVQKPNGDLHDSEEEGRQTAFYAHGQATLALGEAYALTQDPALRPPLERAVQYICASQGLDGGWRYQPRAEGDLSVTGWQVMALQSARMAGLEVPEEVLDRCRDFLDRVAVERGARYRYQAGDPPQRFTAALTAQGLLCRQYLGWKREHPALQEGLRYLLRPEHLPEWSAGRRNVYQWYYTTQVLHHAGGEPWETWNRACREVLPRHQVKTGRLAGSWHPTRPEGADHEYGAAAGRLYVTCMCILTLETYYRHLPLYRTFEPDARTPAP